MFSLRPTFTAASRRAFSSTSRAQLARMTVIGRLGTEPEEVPIPGDRTLVRYVLGTNYNKGEEKKTSWFRVASFVQGGQKDLLLGLPKGSLLYVDADARMETYKDGEGRDRSSLSLVARNFEVLSRPRTDDSAQFHDEGLVQDGSH